MVTDVQKLYDEACEQHKQKNYDAVFKILDEIKRLDPTFKRAYYLEALTWEILGDNVKKYYALEKILPLLDFSSPEEKSFANEILARTYNEALEQHKQKNYDAVFKILDEIKRTDPTFKRAYYLEAWTWEILGDNVKKYYALEKILPLLDFSSPEEKSFTKEILARIYNEACEQYKQKNYDAVFRILDKLKHYAPNYKKAYHLEACTWDLLGNYVKEYYALEKILPLLDFSSPEETDFAANILQLIGDTCLHLGLHEEGRDFCRLRKEMFHASENEIDIGKLIFDENSREDSSPESFRALYAECQKTLADIKPYPRKFYAHEKIRMGFLSSDFRSHPVTDWAWSLLTNLDKNLFERCFYSNVDEPDDFTEQLRDGADVWRDIRDLKDEEIAKLIRDDEIDILFDLNGHTKGHRLRAAAYHPASVQVSGIGFMGSTGLDCFEYFLSDVHCAGDESYFVEKLIKLPHSHACYKPRKKIEHAKFPPCLKNNFVTFGSFNQWRKLNDSTLHAWKKILDAVPNSRLLLKTGVLDMDAGKIFAGKHLKSFGFDLARVEMRGYTKTHPADYNDVDVALDTFPYTGVTTTAEALYMGVPVVSLYGDRHGTRFGLSILKNVGLEELAVDSWEKYFQRAVMLANDWELLTLLRKNLRTMMENSPLMNSQLYLQEIQAAFRKILDEQKNFFATK